MFSLAWTCVLMLSSQDLCCKRHFKKLQFVVNWRSMLQQIAFFLFIFKNLSKIIKNCKAHVLTQGRLSRKMTYLTCIFWWIIISETLLTCEDSDLAGYLSCLRIIWLCGEVVTTALRDRCMRTLPWIKLLNLYSVSECHDVATADLTNMPFQNEVGVYSKIQVFQTS